MLNATLDPVSALLVTALGPGDARRTLPCALEVEIVEANIEPIPLLPEADIIGLCGMGVQFQRQKELLSDHRARGHYVVAGGSYASLCPEQYVELADSVVAGEAEVHLEGVLR